MKKFAKLLKELNSTIVSEEIFVKFLYAVVIYLVCLFILIVANMDAMYALIPALGYFITYLIIEAKKDKIMEVEERYPNLNEQIRTARDNINVDNPIVDDLKKEVTEKVKYVRASTFFPVQRVAVALIIIIVLSFFTTFALSKSFEAKELMKDRFSGYLSFFGGRLNGSSNASVALNITEDIYGDIETMELGNQELNIKLMPSSYEVSVREEGDFAGKEFDLTYATDIHAESGKAYEENIPKEQQDIVKNYFLKLAEN